MERVERSSKSGNERQNGRGRILKLKRLGSTSSSGLNSDKSNKSKKCGSKLSVKGFAEYGTDGESRLSLSPPIKSS